MVNNKRQATEKEFEFVLTCIRAYLSQKLTDSLMSTAKGVPIDLVVGIKLVQKCLQFLGLNLWAVASIRAVEVVQI